MWKSTRKGTKGPVPQSPGPLPPEREETDDPKPAGHIQREYCYDYLYSPTLGAVKKIAVRTSVSIGIVG